MTMELSKTDVAAVPGGADWFPTSDDTLEFDTMDTLEFAQLEKSLHASRRTTPALTPLNRLRRSLLGT